jgi:hypothetical protein
LSSVRFDGRQQKRTKRTENRKNETTSAAMLHHAPVLVPRDFRQQTIGDIHGGKFDASRRFRLFLARCDKDLASIFNICQLSIHYRVSSSAIQSHFYNFTEVLDTLIHRRQD